MCYEETMTRQKHLSIRLTPEEKSQLQKIAAEQDLTVGQLVRRAVRSVTGPPGESPERRSQRPVVRRRRRQKFEREQELHWLAENTHEIRRLGGQWIVIEGDELIAHGADFFAVLETAKRRGIEIPFIEWIPRQGMTGSSVGL